MNKKAILPLLLVILLIAMLTTACAPSSVTGQEPKPTATPAEGAGDDIATRIGNQLHQLLASELGVNMNQVEVVLIDAVTWPDACLGKPDPAELCAAAETPGYRVTLLATGDTYVYHTNADGSSVRLAEGPASTAITPPAVCLLPGANESLFLREMHGYCLLYPATHTVVEQDADNINIVLGDIMNHIDPRISISVESADGRTINDVAAQIISDYAVEGEAQYVTVSGFDALMIDQVPGQDFSRVIVIADNGLIFRITIAPMGDAGSDVRESAEALYFLVIDSFRTFPIGGPASDPGPIDAPEGGPAVDPGPIDAPEGGPASDPGPIDGGPADDPDVIGDPTDSLIVIDTLEIQTLESFPVQVRAIVRGQMPDACSYIEAVNVDQRDNAFYINFAIAWQPNQRCAPELTPFEETIELDVKGLSAGLYEVHVNDVYAQSFDLDSSNE